MLLQHHGCRVMTLSTGTSFWCRQVVDCHTAQPNPLFFSLQYTTELLFMKVFRATALILIGDIRLSTWVTPRAHTQKHVTTEIDHCLECRN